MPNGALAGVNEDNDSEVIRNTMKDDDEDFLVNTTMIQRVRDIIFSGTYKTSLSWLLKKKSITLRILLSNFLFFVL
jgi:hypothetical protein